MSGVNQRYAQRLYVDFPIKLSPLMVVALRGLGQGGRLKAMPGNGSWVSLCDKDGTCWYLAHKSTVLALYKHGLLVPVTRPQLHWKLTKAGKAIARRLQ